MGKHKDLAGILLLVIIGMFIPFLGSIAITYGFNFTQIDNWLKISSTFGYFLLIFAFEMFVVYLYFTLSNKFAEKKIGKYKP
jgi:uncharacterized BrkB/YihY/UPF0761 family membrane protein